MEQFSTHNRSQPRCRRPVESEACAESSIEWSCRQWLSTRQEHVSRPFWQAIGCAPIGHLHETSELPPVFSAKSASQQAVRPLRRRRQYPIWQRTRRVAGLPRRRGNSDCRRGLVCFCHVLALTSRSSTVKRHDVSVHFGGRKPVGPIRASLTGDARCVKPAAASPFFSAGGSE